jgi:putative transposase
MRIIENFLPGEYYHIYNRGINGENIFKEEKNYAYFLQLYTKHIPAVADTYCYCFLKNHFHLLVRINDAPLTDSKPPHRAFGNLFNAYAQAINKVYGRTGSLFERPFKRRIVLQESYFTWLVWYIHHNAQRHQLTPDFRTWPHSSYQSVISEKPTLLKRNELIGWFDNIDYFIKYHQQQNKDIHDVIIEYE